MLEFNGVLRSHTVGISMVEINVVVNLWGMEVTWLTDGKASNNTSVGAWDTTVVVTEVIDVVFSSLPFELSNSLLGIGASSWLRSLRDSSIVSIEHHI